MTCRPILFSGEMVRAILDGRKTQTRRVVNPQPQDWEVIEPVKCERYNPTRLDRHGEMYPGPEVFGFSNEDSGWTCPYGGPGDRLWVRETFKHVGNLLAVAPKYCRYRADGGDGPWKPSIFMPKWASRITIEITNVMVERLQEITATDCKAEGIPSRGMEAEDGPNIASAIMYIHDYEKLWDSINRKKHHWSSNPWVWVIEFKKL